MGEDCQGVQYFPLILLMNMSFGKGLRESPSETRSEAVSEISADNPASEI